MSAVEQLDEQTQQVFEQIKSLTFMQTANLVKAFEEEFGISAAPAAVAVAAPAAGGAGGGEAAEEGSDEVTVMLEDVGGNKIAVLKEVRNITGLGLKEAKELVDTAPKPVKEGVKKEDAAKMKEVLEAAGAKVSLK